MIIENVTIIGVGLIGGSFALALKEQQLAKNIIGVDASEINIEKALALGLIDETLSLEDAVKKKRLNFFSNTCRCYCYSCRKIDGIYYI